MLPILKFQTALVEEHTKQCIQKGIEGNRLDAATSISGATLRMVFSKYREIARCEEKKRACFRKACCTSFKIVFMLLAFEGSVLRERGYMFVIGCYRVASNL